tara:strand:- start:49 stop:468 length:420 start_codon:yes stop_codon:yes gene_type:complete
VKESLVCKFARSLQGPLGRASTHEVWEFVRENWGSKSEWCKALGFRHDSEINVTPTYLHSECIAGASLLPSTRRETDPPELCLWQIDHIHPQANGGDDSISNYAFVDGPGSFWSDNLGLHKRRAPGLQKRAIVASASLV